MAPYVTRGWSPPPALRRDLLFQALVSTGTGHSPASRPSPDACGSAKSRRHGEAAKGLSNFCLSSAVQDKAATKLQNPLSLRAELLSSPSVLSLVERQKGL